MELCKRSLPLDELITMAIAFDDPKTTFSFVVILSPGLKRLPLLDDISPFIFRKNKSSEKAEKEKSIKNIRRHFFML